MLLIARRLDLYGGYLFVFRDEEVNLHVIFPVVGIAVGIKIERPALTPQHLGDDIFHNHTLVYAQLIEEYCAVQLVFGIRHIHKRERNQKPRVAHITFERTLLRTQRKPYLGVGAVIAVIGYHCLVQPDKGILISAEPRRLIQRGNLEPLFLFRQLRRDVIENGEHPVLVPLCKLCHILAV